MLESTPEEAYKPAHQATPIQHLNHHASMVMAIKIILKTEGYRFKC